MADQTIERTTTVNDGVEHTDVVETKHVRGQNEGEGQIGAAVLGGVGGAVIGGVVGGPVGAVIGGAVGSATGATAGLVDEDGKDETVVTHEERS